MGVWETDVHLLANSSDDKKAAVNIVIGAYRSIRSPVAYVSIPITTGKRFYEVLERHGVKSLEELLAKDKTILHNEIISPNIAGGIMYADNIAKRVGVPVIAPAVFEAKQQRWSQGEYMFLWFRVIEERAKEMHLSDGWEYSTGCCLEFVRAMELQFGFINPLKGMEFFPGKEKKDAESYKRMRSIKVYDAKGDEIRIDKGAEMIGSAVKNLKYQGFAYDALIDPLCKLLSIGYSGQSAAFLSRAVAFIEAPYEYDWGAMHRVAEKLQLVPE